MNRELLILLAILLPSISRGIDPAAQPIAIKLGFTGWEDFRFSVLYTFPQPLDFTPLTPEERESLRNIAKRLEAQHTPYRSNPAGQPGFVILVKLGDPD